MKRRTFLAGVGALAVSGSAAAWLLRDDRPIALVYRGPAALPGCPEAVAELIDTAPTPLRPVFCGPDEDVPLDAESLSKAVLYAQPGGGTLEDAWEHMWPHTGDIRDFVSGGGRYLGFCLGGYLAGATPGFGLLPGDTARYISSRRSTIDTEDDAVVQVTWRDEERHMFFQDGPVFRVKERDVTVLSRYRNDEIAAAVAPYGAGAVGVVGPHPEADESWYKRGLTNPDGIRFDLGHDLLSTVMAYGQAE